MVIAYITTCTQAKKSNKMSTGAQCQGLYIKRWEDLWASIKKWLADNDEVFLHLCLYKAKIVCKNLAIHR